MGQGWKSDAWKLLWGVERICNYSLLRNLGEGRFLGRLGFPPVIVFLGCLLYYSHKTLNFWSPYCGRGSGGDGLPSPSNSQF